jgi:formylglycine-generating enzyme required for sulfatase activity
MVCIKGGMFRMGDVFDEDVRFATPVHEVTVSSFYLDKHEVTVEEFATFAKATGYVTSAERGDKRAAQSGKAPAPQTKAEYDARLASGGALILDPAARETSWGLGASWRNPLYQQTPQDPVVCVSWTDAVNYCNWLSTKEGLPISYDVKSGDLLDAKGQPTTDVTKVKGYRLPTEAEWEYAARERGKKVRFGNGQDIARPAEMNFNAAEGEFKYAEKGKLRGKTVPVGSFKPNSLGLHDMSGNVWEWCSDIVGLYPDKPQTNPYQQKGVMGPRRAARGGPWAGDASFARVSARIGWVADDRCNNIGFRIARSK